MKHIILLALVVITANVANAQSVFPNLIGEANYEQTSATTFIPVDSVTYTYNGNHTGDLTHPLDYTKEHFYGYMGAGVYDSLATIVYQTFNTNDYVDSEIITDWDTTKYKNDEDFVFAYDSKNNDTSKVEQVWDSSSETGFSWVNNDKNTYTYNTDNYVTQNGYYGWSVLDTAWLIHSQTYYTYDSHNNNTFLYIADYTAGLWDTIWGAQTVFNYNVKGEDSLQITLDYNFNTYKWDTTNRTFTTYKANSTNDSIQVVQSWGLSAPHWTNIDSTTYGYDDNNNNTSIIIDKWDTTHWGNNSQELFTYNSFNQTTSDILTLDNGPYIPPYAGYEHFYYYAFPTGVNQLSANNNQLSIYPNPASNELTVVSGQLTINEITITNVLGQTVFITANPLSPFLDGEGPGVRLDVSNLPNGLYFITATTATGVVTEKFVVVKN